MEGKAYLADKGGRFASDAHRRVLAHLTPPEDDYGWTPFALLVRMAPDAHTDFQSVEQLQPVLDELEKDGLVTHHEGDIYQMSQNGFDLLTGPILDEPTPEDAAGGTKPALIGTSGAASRISGSGPAGVPAQQEQPSAEGSSSASSS